MDLNIVEKLKGLGGMLHGGSMLGIDIGTGAMKIAEISGKPSQPALVNYGELMRSAALRAMHEPAKTADSESVEAQVADHIRDLLHQMGSDAKNAVFGLPSGMGTFQLMHFPKMKQKDLHDAVLYQTERMITTPLSEMVLDWEIVENTEGDDQHAAEIQVLAAAMPRDVIDRYVRIAKHAGISLTALEAEPFALVRAANRIGEHDLYGVLDFGGYRSTLVIAEAGKARQVTEIEMTGSKLTNALAKSMVIDDARAEEMKVSHGLVSSGGTDLGRTLGPFVDGMIGEVRSAFSEYVRVNNQVVRTLYLSGGAARLKGLAEHIANQFEIDVQPLPALRGMDVPETVRPHVDTVGMAYGIAVGLALRRGDEGRKRG